MKKPLILLVDDDPAVLTALEAALAPAFGEVCRIEAFTDAHEVLEAMPGWAEEGRSIAVAVVDQKMPGMTGTDLLKALRGGGQGGREPAHWMRTVLLTGYAGLESALEGKNEAGIDRYLEKPWEVEGLVETCSSLCRSFLSASRFGSYYEFREARSADEIRTHLELRYQVYRVAANTAHFVAQPDGGLDVDAYDAVSRFFILSGRGCGRTSALGTLRVTGQEPAPAGESLREALRFDSALREKLGEPRDWPLPMMKYLIDREAVGALFDLLTHRSERVVEPGRLTLDPAFRDAGGRSFRHLARHIIEGATGFFFFLSVENAVLTCTPPHDAIYRKLGFMVARGTQPRHHEAFGAEISCLHGKPEWVSSPARERVLSLAVRVRRTGAACRCPTFPTCLPGPYETGNFAVTDIFCPLRASEILQGSLEEPA